MNDGSTPRLWGQRLTVPVLRQHHRFNPTAVGTTRDCINAHTRLAGSTPRLWGQLEPAKSGQTQRRFNPTAVGTTAEHRVCRSCSAVQPHGCGDNFCAFSVNRSVIGSTPRLWGQLHRGHLFAVAARFNPTAVGTTIPSSSGTVVGPVQPHGCGDNVHADGWWPRHLRFNPTAVGTTQARVRVQVVNAVQPHGCGDNTLAEAGRSRSNWFNPTAVGTTQPLPLRALPTPVQPHGCGDNIFLFRIIIEAYGSTPRLWGQQAGLCAIIQSPRFNPTAVGTTWATVQWKDDMPVQPHGCGDNDRSGCLPPPTGGSTPRLWGQHQADRALLVQNRFNPTAVGTTLQKPEGHYVVFGSTPRLWGQREDADIGLRPSRFNPTAVGTTTGLTFPKQELYGSTPRLWGQRVSACGGGLPGRFNPTAVGTTKTVCCLH